jgi:hypothetical protein
MSDLSILIAARNEKYLARTVENILANIEGDTEVIVVCDGEQAEPALTPDPRVQVIRYEKSIGQRPAINAAARASRAQFIMKCDAHCAFDKGFDVKLMADCEYDWTVIPRQYQLEEETWEPKLRKKTDSMFFRSPYSDYKPFQIGFYDKNCYLYFKKEYQAWKKAEWRQGDICDTMASLGACFFMHRDRFWELGGLDEEHGHWGQMGVELGCKAWLSGGRQVVNKKTWFAHLWRRTAPWPMNAKSQQAARDYSKDLWINGKWPLQKRPLSWMIEHFGPVPTWNGQFATPKVATQDLTLLYYTANRVNATLGEKVRIQLKHACRDAPLITVSQKPMDFGDNICVGDIGRSLQNIYKQVLTGARQVTTEYVALCEDDTLYVPEHFNYRPPKNKFAYNLHRWNLHIDSEPQVFSYRNRAILSQCIAPTKLLIECLEQRMNIDVPKEFCGEMGFFEKQLGLKEYETETFTTTEPNVVVCHNKNTSGRKYHGKDAEPVENLPPWGNAKELIKNIWKKDDMAKFNRSATRRRQHSYIGSIIFTMDELWDNIYSLRDRRRTLERMERRMSTGPPFIKQIIDGETFDDERLVSLTYYGTLTETQRLGRAKAIRQMRDMVKLALDIRDYGLKAPLDMWREGSRLVLHRGWRRLLIMHELHTRGTRKFPKVPCRIFKNIHIFRKYNPSPRWVAGKTEETSIHGLATQQFTELGCHATDKYWVHGYTQLYDRHFAHLRNKKIKLLEIGVLRGASLLLWKKAFPKGVIYGIDKNTAIWKPHLKGQKRIKVFVGHQEDQEFLKQDVVPTGPYDVIIDDGGHTPEEQLASFEVMWPMVAPGGIYVVEDLHGNYWNKRAKNGPLFMEEMKKKLDDVVGTNDCLDIHSMTCYYNILFLEKN